LNSLRHHAKILHLLLLFSTVEMCRFSNLSQHLRNDRRQFGTQISDIIADNARCTSLLMAAVAILNFC